MRDLNIRIKQKFNEVYEFPQGAYLKLDLKLYVTVDLILSNIQL